MTKVDFSDPVSSILNPALNPAVHAKVQGEAKKSEEKLVRRGRGPVFSSLLEQSREEAAEELGELRDLPPSREIAEKLLDDARSAGDDLRNRPFPQEILRYKKAVRDFIHYVVENSLVMEEQIGIPKGRRPGYRGRRGSPDSQERTVRHVIQVVDRKLEEMAARLLSEQLSQLELLARLEEINGLLVDLLQ
ncbi:MAG: DUF327 family protein [Treponema sp.]|jgi:uncharacterized protein YaaR (DUF327 family)|nr:DUF327 family protein [Treponema sp.]